MNKLYITFIFTFIISFSLYIKFIPFLKRKELVQTERLLGPSNHKSKNLTPTFGSIIFVIVPSIIYFWIFKINLYSFTILFPFISFFVIGLIDDAIISETKNNEGLSGTIRIILEVIASIIFVYLLKRLNILNENITIFNYQINIGYFYIILVVLMIISSSNSFNLTDGVDGLLSGITLIILITILVISFYKENYHIIVFSILLFSSILSYFTFNCTNAKIFMGDSGSLAIGAFISSALVILKKEEIILIIGVVAIIEALSVIIQVIYFKITKGKRIFKMAPIHHHFELSGLSEIEIDILFWLISILLVLISILLI